MGESEGVLDRKVDREIKRYISSSTDNTTLVSGPLVRNNKPGAVHVFPSCRRYARASLVSVNVAIHFALDSRKDDLFL